MTKGQKDEISENNTKEGQSKRKRDKVTERIKKKKKLGVPDKRMTENRGQVKDEKEKMPEKNTNKKEK